MGVGSGGREARMGGFGMTSLTVTKTSFRFAVFLMIAVGAGCASKGDSLGGTGGSGAGGSGGTIQSGGATGTGGTTGTGGADPASLQAMLTAAESTWAAAKPSCPDYVYRSDQSSVFGSCSKTTIEIANDQPIRRSFVSCAYVPDGGVADQWDEVGAPQIGTHQEGTLPWTVEDLLADCQRTLDSVLADPPAYGVSLSFNAEGIPVNCLAYMRQCVDDCTDGLNIEGFTCEASPSVDAGLLD